MSTEQRQRLKRLITITILIIAIEVLYYVSVIIRDGYYECPIKAFTGYDCAGCGGTRMIMSLLHFDIYQAFRWNPFMFVTIPVVSAVSIYQAYLYVRKTQILKWFSGFLMVYAVSVISFSIIRNIPILSILLPTKL